MSELLQKSINEIKEGNLSLRKQFHRIGKLNLEIKMFLIIMFL